MPSSVTGPLNAVVRTADEPTFAVVGTVLQFVSTPEQIGANLSVMRAGIPPRAIIPLHSHADPEIFYVTEGEMEVFQDNGTSSGWQSASPGDVVTIAGGVRHALRNPNFTRFRFDNTIRFDSAFARGAGVSPPPPWSNGRFSWRIPNRYQASNSNGAGRLFTTTIQTFAIDASGTVTITKQGEAVSRHP